MNDGRIRHQNAGARQMLALEVCPVEAVTSRFSLASHDRSVAADA